MTNKLILAVSKINHVNPVCFPLSACGAHWPEMALQFHDLM